MSERPLAFTRYHFPRCRGCSSDDSTLAIPPFQFQNAGTSIIHERIEYVCDNCGRKYEVY